MTAKYFIFDMDETLAELYSVYYFIASLRLQEACKEDKVFCNDMSNSLRNSLDNAYGMFVEGVLMEEISTKPLGILRPGILTIMKRLRNLQKDGKVKAVIIYSNNGHLESLEFIRDLIHKYIGSNSLIKECIHWDHPMRDEERSKQAGLANKTWNVIKNIMVKGNCKASDSIEPNDIFFFDDLDHVDLQKNLGNNYYKVPGYNFKASFDRLEKIYTRVLKLANVPKEQLLNYLIELFVRRGDEYQKIMDKKDEMEGMIEIFKSRTRGTVREDVRVPEPDDGIMMMNEAISRIDLKVVGGGVVKRKTKVKGVMKKRMTRKLGMKTRIRKIETGGYQNK